MPSADFINPLLNPIFLSFIVRAALFFLLGFILIAGFYKFRFKDIFKTEVGKIYLGWLILAPTYFAAIFLGRIIGLFAILLFAFLAIREIKRIAELPGEYEYALWILAVFSVGLTSYYTRLFYSLPLVYFFVLTGVAVKRNDGKQGFYHAAVSLFAAIWIIFGLSHFILLSHLNNTIDNTRSLLLMVILAVSLSDVGAYLIGKTCHKLGFLDSYKIACNISPNKTYIGVSGHIIGAGAGIYAMYFAIEKYLPAYQWVIMAVLIGVVGMIGGMTNSMFKRFYGVKDSARLIPGHGGILDRIDSSVWAIVISYYYLLLVL